MSQGSQRRSSPVYDDPERNNRMESSSRGYHTSSASHSGYSNYQSGPTDLENDDQPLPRRSAPPKAKESSSRRSPSPPLVFRGSLVPPKSSPPPPSRRTQPREEYLVTSLQPSTPLQDATLSRKLIVLDLNGSLLLRSAHKPRHPHRGGPQKGQPNGRWDPYADTSQLRPLRTVHPRPYLGAFKAYILHEATKKWLDTMVWSSAQPHSVADMVDKCFQDRKDELRAVWARDTLGLTGDRKTQTLKDLEKPWSELPSPHIPTPNSLSSDIEPIAHNTSNPSTEHATSSSSKPSLQTQHTHSAQTTLLIDDSPLKAALQPWNHLCIREYVQEMRRWDLGVADWEVARAKAREAREAKEEAEKEAERRREAEAQDPESSVSAPALEQQAVEGPSQAHEAEAEAEDAAAEDSAEKPTKKRKLKRLVKREAVQRAKEEKEREALLAMADIEDGEDIDVEEALAKLKAKMRYDETLLAVVGVLDRIKHESNVAGWMRAGGLLDIELLADTGEDTKAPEPKASSEPTPETSHLQAHEAQSRSDSPAGTPTPAKRRRVGSSPQPEEKNGEPEMDVELRSSSPPPMPPPSSELTSYADRSSSPAPEPMDDQAVEERAATGVPLEFDVHASGPEPTRLHTANGDAHKSLNPSLWYEKPEVMTYWAERGRRALKELGIEVDSGVVPAPGGLQH
ncbi:unnamed protein product [Cyclocybe aegerita]|uniref:FCP1 homology domain-containing protein n=1 Tax=Cyclocybe aegerita TaxID=1973307 RepID=A0A8S0W5V8_CYCAE|nr:unnamed protein product [Cyclocybe aegerita]